VSTILSAIDRACQWTDEDLHTQEGKTVPIPTSDPQETIHYFHAHDHSGVQAKRDALNRLQHSMIAAWNHSLKEEKGLTTFLSNIQNALCIEGATRDALSQVVLTMTQPIASQTFWDAMNVYYQQANALLTAFHFIPTLHNVVPLILNAYNGQPCLERGDDPTVISDKNVKDKLTELSVLSEEREASSYPLDLITKPEYSIVTRYSLIKTIQPYCNDLHIVEFSGICSIYYRLLLLEQPGKNINTSEYFKMLRATNSLDARVKQDVTILSLAITNNYVDFALELIIETRKKPDFTRSTEADSNLLYRLVANESGATLLTQWLEKSPETFCQIPSEV